MDNQPASLPQVEFDAPRNRCMTTNATAAINTVGRVGGLAGGWTDSSTGK